MVKGILIVGALIVLMVVILTFRAGNANAATTGSFGRTPGWPPPPPPPSSAQSGAASEEARVRAQIQYNIDHSAPKLNAKNVGKALTDAGKYTAKIFKFL